ncbi:hypothetical protein [Caulobacter endophyticus]|uniref:hypothetical protein n=1 Tax=Caulobacter endophyticus TaxID=2172652 RepID=UPI00240FD29C|nr:hypothetical protein [Caulobacter endophyticus]MDG2530012.1 hypothetical protein [Caulobacter endophyticus]
MKTFIGATALAAALVSTSVWADTCNGGGGLVRMTADSELRVDLVRDAEGALVAHIGWDTLGPTGANPALYFMASLRPTSERSSRLSRLSVGVRSSVRSPGGETPTELLVFFDGVEVARQPYPQVEPSRFGGEAYRYETVTAAGRGGERPELLDRFMRSREIVSEARTADGEVVARARTALPGLEGWERAQAQAFAAATKQSRSPYECPPPPIAIPAPQ